MPEDANTAPAPQKNDNPEAAKTPAPARPPAPEAAKKAPAEPAKKAPAQPAKKAPAQPAKKAPAEPAKKAPAPEAEKSPPLVDPPPQKEEPPPRDPAPEPQEEENAPSPEDAAAFEMVIQPLLDALAVFDTTPEALTAIDEAAQSTIGEEWRTTIYDILPGCSEDTQTYAYPQLESVLAYEAAITAWEEACTILSDPSVVDPHWLYDRIETYQTYLPYYFGEEGDAVAAQVAAILSEPEQDAHAPEAAAWPEDVVAGDGWRDPAEEPEPEATQDESKALEEGIDPELLWHFKSFLTLKDYYDRTISRISARCIRLGGIAIEQYPQLSYLIDLLQEITEIGETIENAPELEELVQARMPGGRTGFEQLMKDFRRDLENTAEPVGTAKKLLTENKEEFIESLGGFVDQTKENKKEEKKKEAEAEEEKEETKKEKEETPPSRTAEDTGGKAPAAKPGGAESGKTAAPKPTSDAESGAGDSGPQKKLVKRPVSAQARPSGEEGEGRGPPKGPVKKIKKVVKRPVARKPGPPPTDTAGDGSAPEKTEQG